MSHPTSKHVVEKLQSEVSIPDGWTLGQIQDPSAHAELYLGDKGNPTATVDVTASNHRVEVSCFHRAKKFSGRDIDVPCEIGTIQFDSMDEAIPVIEEALDESVLSELSEEANETGAANFESYFSLPESPE